MNGSFNEAAGRIPVGFSSPRPRPAAEFPWLALCLLLITLGLCGLLDRRPDLVAGPQPNLLPPVVRVRPSAAEAPAAAKPKPAVAAEDPAALARRARQELALGHRQEAARLAGRSLRAAAAQGADSEALRAAEEIVLKANQPAPPPRATPEVVAAPPYSGPREASADTLTSSDVAPGLSFSSSEGDYPRSNYVPRRSSQRSLAPSLPPAPVEQLYPVYQPRYQSYSYSSSSQSSRLRSSESLLHHRGLTIQPYSGGSASPYVGRYR